MLTEQQNITVVGPCRWHVDLFQNRSKSIVDAGRIIFSQSGLVVPNSPIGDREFGLIDAYFAELTSNQHLYSPEDNWNKPGGFIEHCNIAGEVAFALSSAINNKIGPVLDPNAEKAALKLHDLGRFGSHSFMETDVLTDTYWQLIGLRPDLKDLTHSAYLYWDDKETHFEQLSYAKKVSIISDISSKRSSSDKSRLRRKEELVAEVDKGKLKYTTKLDKTPYEQMLVDFKLAEYSRREHQTIEATVNWFDSLGIDINQVAGDIPLK